MSYAEYLASAEWKIKRAAALERAGYRCQLCNALHRLEVHHRTYERVGCEVPADLTVLCRTCHGRHHAGERKPPDDVYSPSHKPAAILLRLLASLGARERERMLEYVLERVGPESCKGVERVAFQAFIDNPQISEPSADMPMDVVAFLERNVFCGPVSDSMVNHSKVRDALLLSIKKEEQAIARHLNQMPHGPHRDRLAGDISALRVEAVELGVGL